MNEIINDLLNGQTPFAQARRHRTGRAWTGQDGAGNACSGCTRSGQDGTGSAGAGSTWAECAAAGRTWTGLYPNTELDVDLKLVTQKQGRMELGEYLDGMITRDGDDHFTFVENDTERGKATRRNPSIYMGQWINVKRRADRHGLSDLQTNEEHRGRETWRLCRQYDLRAADGSGQARGGYGPGGG